MFTKFSALLFLTIGFAANSFGAAAQLNSQQSAFLKRFHKQTEQSVNLAEQYTAKANTMLEEQMEDANLLTAVRKANGLFAASLYARKPTPQRPPLKTRTLNAPLPALQSSARPITPLVKNASTKK